MPVGDCAWRGLCVAGGVCVVRELAWRREACMAKGGHVRQRGNMCGKGGHVWWGACMVKGMHGERGACMAREGMHGRGTCMVGGMCAGEMATEAGGTHPTGMHSCYHKTSCWGEADVGGQVVGVLGCQRTGRRSLYCEVRCIMGNDHMGPVPCGQTDRQIQLYTLRYRNFVGGR